IIIVAGILFHVGSAITEHAAHHHQTHAQQNQDKEQNVAAAFAAPAIKKNFHTLKNVAARDFGADLVSVGDGLVAGGAPHLQQDAQNGVVLPVAIDHTAKIFHAEKRIVGHGSGDRDRIAIRDRDLIDCVIGDVAVVINVLTVVGARKNFDGVAH